MLSQITSTPESQILSIEMSTKCDANCYVCPRRMIERVNKEMPFEDIKRITKEACEMGIKIISPHLWGEPTMHTQYVDILKYFKELKKEYPHLQFLEYTNGSGWDRDEVCEAQLDLFDRLVVSIDGATHECMKQNRPGLDPLKTEENVKKFSEMRKKRGQTKPHLCIRMTMMPRTQDQVELYREKWTKYADEVAFLPLQNFDKSLVEEVDLRANKPCDRLFYQVVVTVNKNVVLCCSDYNETYIIGNLENNSLKDLWYGEEMTKIRKLHLDHKSNEISNCKACTYRTYLQE